MDNVLAEIVEAKRRAGEDTFLWLRIDGVCTLWEADPLSGKAVRMLGVWHLNRDECDQLIETDLLDRAN